MKHEILVALNVIDDEMYAAYRREMTPILQRYGGGFGYDFKISETLKAEVAHAINRVFTVYFGSVEEKELFLTNPEYQEIKRRYYLPAVPDTTIIAALTRLS